MRDSSNRKRLLIPLFPVYRVPSLLEQAPRHLFFASQGRRLFEGGAYSRAALIRGGRLFEGGAYSRAALIRGRRLFEGGAYSRAALIRGRR